MRHKIKTAKIMTDLIINKEEDLAIVEVEDIEVTETHIIVVKTKERIMIVTKVDSMIEDQIVDKMVYKINNLIENQDISVEVPGCRMNNLITNLRLFSLKIKANKKTSNDDLFLLNVLWKIFFFYFY